MKDNEVQISWRNSQNCPRTLKSIIDFFEDGSSGIHGRVCREGITGARDGWACVLLTPQRNPVNVFGFPSEVTDVIKLERDLSKYVSDHGRNPQMTLTLSHKCSTRCVPLFQRWEPLTKKFEKNVALDVNSVATVYLEHGSRFHESAKAAIVPMRFESFETKTRNKWQKGEGLTLLAAGSDCSFAALILAIFGTPTTRLLHDADTLQENVIMLETGSSADDCVRLKQGLTGAQ